MRSAIALVVLLALPGCDTLRARLLANEAVGLYKKGDVPAAIARFEEAARLDGSIATIHLDLGFAYLATYQASPKSKEGHEAGGKALAALQRFIALRPDDGRGRSYLVQTFVDTSRYDDAVAYFRGEVERDPPSLEAVTTLGLIAARTGRFTDAIRWYQRRVQLAPGDPDGHYNLGVLLWEHLHNHAEVAGEARVAMADQALGSLRRSVELRPGAPEGYTYINLVFRERAAGQTDEALRAADLQEAERHLKLALEKMKAQGAAPATKKGAR